MPPNFYRIVETEMAEPNLRLAQILASWQRDMPTGGGAESAREPCRR